MYAGDSLDWARRVCECAAHEEGQAWYGEVGRGFVGVKPVCMLEGAYEGWTGNPQGVQEQFCHGATYKMRQGAREGER